MRREFHIAVFHKTGAARQLVTHPDKQKQRDTDIGCSHAVPVDAVIQEGLVVLAQRDDQTEHESQNRANREKA